MAQGMGDWKIFSGTLEEWNAKQGNKFRIVVPHFILHGADVTTDRIAVSPSGVVVAHELVKLESTICFYYPSRIRQNAK